jgi:hypothetical protein
MTPMLRETSWLRPRAPRPSPRSRPATRRTRQTAQRASPRRRPAPPRAQRPLGVGLALGAGEPTGRVPLQRVSMFKTLTMTMTSTTTSTGYACGAAPAAVSVPACLADVSSVRSESPCRRIFVKVVTAVSVLGRIAFVHISTRRQLDPLSARR